MFWLILLGIQTRGTSWEHKLEDYFKRQGEGLDEGLGKDTIVTGVLWVGQICIGSATGTDKTVSEVLGSWTELPETTWIPFVCAKARFAIAMCGTTVSDRLNVQRTKKHHQLKLLIVWIGALPGVRYCARALQHHSFCSSSSLRASWKSEGQPRTWIFDIWYRPAHVRLSGLIAFSLICRIIVWRSNRGNMHIVVRHRSTFRCGNKSWEITCSGAPHNVLCSTAV